MKTYLTPDDLLELGCFCGGKFEQISDGEGEEMKVKRFVKAFLIASGLFLLIIGLGILDELIFQHTGCRVVLPITIAVVIFLVAYIIID